VMSRRCVTDIAAAAAAAVTTAGSSQDAYDEGELRDCE